MTDSPEPSPSTVDELRAEVEGLRGEIADLNRRFLVGQLDSWRARIDELDMQVHLARMDAKEELTPIVAQLNERWGRARREVDDLGEGAGDALRALGDGVQRAVADLRDGMQQALDTLRS